MTLDARERFERHGHDTGYIYLPGLEARGTPLLLDERHVSLEVVVHVELGVLLVDDFKGPLSAFNPQVLGFTRL